MSIRRELQQKELKSNCFRPRSGSDNKSAEIESNFFIKFIKKFKYTVYKVWRNNTWTTQKSDFCRHKVKWWLIHAAEGAVKNFILAASLKLLFRIGMSAKRMKLPTFQILKVISPDTMMCGAFVGVFRLLLCNLRKLRNKEDGFNAAIAGFIAALWLSIDRSRNRRIQIASFVLARSVDSMFKNIESNQIPESILGRFCPSYLKTPQESEEEHMSDDKNSSKSKQMSALESFWPVFMASVLTMFALYTWFFEIEHFPHGVERAMRIMTQPKPNDWNLVDKIGRVYGHLHYGSPMKTSRYHK